jgi:heat shock protein HslJ
MRPIAILVAAVVLTACTSVPTPAPREAAPSTPAPTPAPSEAAPRPPPSLSLIQAADVARRRFVASAVAKNGKPFALLPGTRLLLAFDDAGRLGANAGCNGAGGSYEIQDGRLVTERLFVSLIGCGGERSWQEGWFFSVLSSGPWIGRDGDTLVLIAGDVVIRFVEEGAAS